MSPRLIFDGSGIAKKFWRVAMGDAQTYLQTLQEEIMSVLTLVGRYFSYEQVT